MKRLLLLFGLAVSAWAQNPSCTWKGTLTTATSSVAQPNNTANPNCNAFALTWNSTGFTALSIQIEGADTIAGTYTAFTGSSTVLVGTNPGTALSGATVIQASAKIAYIRVTVNSVTGSGGINWQIFGYNGVTPAARGGSGGGGGGGVVTQTWTAGTGGVTAGQVVCPNVTTNPSPINAIPCPITVNNGVQIEASILGIAQTSATAGNTFSVIVQGPATCTFDSVRAPLAGNVAVYSLEAPGLCQDGNSGSPRFGIPIAGIIMTSGAISTTQQIWVMGPGLQGSRISAVAPMQTTNPGLPFQENWQIKAGNATSAQGTGTKLQFSTGSTTSGHCVSFDATGNTQDSGAPCGTASNVLSQTFTSAGTPGNFTLANSAILFMNGVTEMLRIWATDPDSANFNTENLYIGLQSGFSQPSDNVSAGYYNTALGAYTLYSISTGSYNVAVGESSLTSTNTGINNTAIGSEALRDNTIGESGTAVGTATLDYNIDGSFNTAIGSYSGQNFDNDIPQFRIVSDDHMTLIGYGATKDNASTLTNGTAIGSDAHVLVSNQVVIGNKDVTTQLLQGVLKLGALSAANGGLDATAPTTANAIKPLQVKAGCTATVNGAACYDTTNDNIHAAKSSADAVILQTTATSAGNGNCMNWINSGGSLKAGDAGAPCGSGGGTGGGVLTYSGPTLSILSGTSFCPVGGGGACSATETNVDIDSAAVSTVSNMYVQLSVALGVGNSVAVTWRKNASSQTVTCTISGASATSCSDTTHSFAVAQADLLDYQLVFSGTIVVTPTVTIMSQFGTVNAGVTSVSAVAPITSTGGTTPQISATYQGNGGKVQASTGSTTTNNCVKFDANGNTVDAGAPCGTGVGTVTSVGFTGGLISVATATTTPALTVAGTSGGIPYFSGASTWASSAALTAHGVVIGGGAATAPTSTAAGTAGQVLTSNGPSADPTFQAASGAVTSVGGLTGAVPGGPILVEQHTASSSAELDFTTCISSTYDDYMVRFVNVLPASNSIFLEIQVSTDGGSSYDTGANYGWGFQQSVGNNAIVKLGASGSTFIPIAGLSGLEAVGNTTLGVSGQVDFAGPASSSLNKGFRADTDFLGTFSSFLANQHGAGYYQSNTAINAFRVIASSGNIASGTVRCYGIAKQ